MVPGTASGADTSGAGDGCAWGRRGAGGGPVVEEPSEVPSINRQAGVQEEEEEDEEEEQLSCRPTCCNQRRKQPGAPGTAWKSAHAWLMSHSQIREDFLLRRFRTFTSPRPDY